MERLSRLNKASQKKNLETFGKSISFLCISILFIILTAIIYMVLSKGLTTFTINKVNPIEFIFEDNWNLGKAQADGNLSVGAFAMIFGSFSVTLLAAVLATPLAVGTAIFIVELSPAVGRKIVQPAIELLVGVPSVVYGLLGLTVVVPWVREHFGGTGFGILPASIVLTFMILPTISSMSINAMDAVDNSKREGALALGVTRWQMIHKVVLNESKKGILTGIIMGMARAFGEALAVQMVIGNASVIPKSISTSTSTLTSILTMSMGNTIDGQPANNILWSLAMILMLMSLLFVLIIHFVGKER